MKRMCVSFTALMLVFCMIAGCGSSGETADSLPNGAYENEILTTKAVDQDKTLITVRIENNVAQSVDLESVLEAQFPDVDFVVLHDGSVSSEYNLRADLLNGTECDLIMSRRLNIVEDIAADYLLDLSSESFVDDYFFSAVDSCMSSDGNIYYLPGPSDIYGIVYDKDLFDEYGWELPHSYSEFVELCNTIREANIQVSYVDEDGNAQIDTLVPIQPTMMYPDMFQIVFNTYNFDNVFAGVDNYTWLTAYQNGDGSMVGHMEPAVETFKKLFNDGILSVSDWDVQPYQRSMMMYTYHTTAMVIENQSAINYAQSFAEASGNDDAYHEVAMMPFWTSDEDESDYVYSIPSYFMAINKKSAEESDEKKQILLDVFSYLSSVEGQEILMNGSPQISNVTGVDIESSSFMDAIRDTVNEERVISTFYYAAGENSKQVEKQLRSTTPDLINGTMSTKEWLLAADQVRDEFLAGTADESEVYGTVETTLTKLESAYTMAELYKEAADADIGICLAGAWRYGTNGRFYQGDITDSSLTCVQPDKEASSDENEFANTIVTSTLTGEQILEILNNNYPSDTSAYSDADDYYVAYGLTIEMDPWASVGNRIISCKTEDGSEIDLEATYTVAYFYGSLPDGITPESTVGETFLESFKSYLAAHDGVIKEPQMTLTLKYDD